MIKTIIVIILFIVAVFVAFCFGKASEIAKDVVRTIDKHNYGTMVVDTRASTKDIYRLEFSKPVQNIVDEDFIIFKVKVYDDQKNTSLNGITSQKGEQQ